MSPDSQGVEALHSVAAHRDHLEGMAESTVNDIRKWAGRIEAASDDEEVLDAARNLKLVAGYLEHAVENPPTEDSQR